MSVFVHCNARAARSETCGRLFRMDDEPVDDADYELKPIEPANAKPPIAKPRPVGEDADADDAISIRLREAEDESAIKRGAAGGSKTGKSAAARPALRLPSDVERAETMRAARADEINQLKNFQLPLGLLLFCGFVDVVGEFIDAGNFGRALQGMGIELIGGTAVMLVAVLITAKARGIKLGAISNALLKLAAIAVTPAAVARMVGPLVRWVPFIGGLLVLGVMFLAIFVLLGLFFDLDESDTWYCVSVMFIVGVATRFLVAWLVKP